MDHEVQDDVNVERAWGEDREPVRFVEHGAREAGLCGGDGGVEAFEVTGGEDAIPCRGPGDQGIGFGEGGRERLFDEDIEICGEKLLRRFGVRDGGRGYGCGVETQAGF